MPLPSPHRYFYILIIASFLVNTPTNAQEGLFYRDSKTQINDSLLLGLLPEYFHLFESEEPLEITIKSNFKKLRRNKYDEVYQPAELIFPLNDSLEIRQNAEVRTRGGIRKKLCTYPPLKVKFEVTDLYDERLKDLSKFKMVVVCKAGKIYKSLLLKEYLVYRMYNIVSEKSFRVRLLHVNFIDSGKKNRCKKAYAFFIEKPKDMAERLGGVLLEGPDLQQRLADTIQETQLALFQYMIGNTDYHVPAGHNVKVLKLQDFQYRYPFLIPYDFDYCGIVDAPYAIPHERLGIKNIRQRLYRGYCRDDQIFNEQFQHFSDKKEALYQLINDFPYLDKSHKIDMLKYLDSFYNQLKTPAKLKDKFMANCLK